MKSTAFTLGAGEEDATETERARLSREGFVGGDDAGTTDASVDELARGVKRKDEKRKRTPERFLFPVREPRSSVPYPSRAGRCRATRGTRGFGRNARARGTRDEVRALAYLTGAAPGVGTADATARRAERLEAPIDFICTACPARALRAARLGRAVLVAAVAERPESIMATIVCVARGECASGRREVRGLEWHRANLTRKTRATEPALRFGYDFFRGSSLQGAVTVAYVPKCEWSTSLGKKALFFAGFFFSRLKFLSSRELWNFVTAE